MTSANANDVKASVAEFGRLGSDAQLALIALIYQELASSIPAESLPTSSEDLADLVEDIEEMSEQQQVEALRDMIQAKKYDQDEVILDPHPSKALGELLQGETEVPTGEYGKLDTNSKLAFWYQIAQKLGSGIVAIPSEYSPSAEVTQLLNSLKSAGNDQIISFVSQVFSQPKSEQPDNSQ